MIFFSYLKMDNKKIVYWYMCVRKHVHSQVIFKKIILLIVKDPYRSLNYKEVNKKNCI